MKKKGFTLIELLAVIVVLAIITLIAVPTILGVIEKSRKRAAESSTLNYIDAVEKYMVLHELDSNKYPYSLEKGKTYYVVEDSSFLYDDKFSLIGKVYAEEEQENIYLSDFITIKGDAPTDGYVVIGEKNTVLSAAFGMKKYEITCDNKTCEVSGSFDSSNIRVSSIEINQVENTTINPGETLQLSATVLPDNATDKNVTWSSSDESIATVDSNGLVTGVSEGTVTITAKAGSKKDIITLVIIDPTWILKTDNDGNGHADLGDLICVKTECFYVYSNDDTNIKALAQYNLYVGGSYDGSSWAAYGSEATGLQDSSMKGRIRYGSYPYRGTLGFGTSNYNSSPIKTYIDSYANYLNNNYNANIKSATAITLDEMKNLGCDSRNRCSAAPSWAKATSFWTSTGSGSSAYCFSIEFNSVNKAIAYAHNGKYDIGVRPFITISSSEV